MQKTAKLVKVGGVDDSKIWKRSRWYWERHHNCDVRLLILKDAGMILPQLNFYHWDSGTWFIMHRERDSVAVQMRIRGLYLPDNPCTSETARETINTITVILHHLRPCQKAIVIFATINKSNINLRLPKVYSDNLI